MYVFFLPFSSWRSSLPYPPINKANNIKSSSRFLTLNFWLLQPQRFELVLCGWRMWPPFLFERWSDEQGSFMLSWFFAEFTLPSWVKFAVMTVAYYYFFGLSKSKGRNSLQWGFKTIWGNFALPFLHPLFFDCWIVWPENTLWPVRHVKGSGRNEGEPVKSFHHLVDLLTAMGEVVWNNHFFTMSDRKVS